MFANRLLLSAVLLVGSFVQTASAEILTQFTDPCNPNIPAEVDITAAWVERSDSTLTFVMTTRGTIPTSVPDPCSITYIWFVDADANPHTGQNPGGWGSEFNVRVRTESSAIGHVDMVGSLPGNDNYNGTVTIIGNKIQLAIDLAQISNPDLFTFRCGAWIDVSAGSGGNNGLTEQSPRAWVSNYAVIYDEETDPSFGVDQNSVVFKCDTGDPFNPATATEAAIDTYQNTDVWPQLHSSELVGDVVEVFPTKARGAENREYFTHSVCIADYGHLRNLSSMKLFYNDAGLFGQMQTKATANQTFKLLAKSGQTGLVPHGRYFLDIRHDYHLEAQATAGEGEDRAYGNTYSQIIINDINDPGNPVQQYQRQAGRGVFMDKVSSIKTDRIDLADHGFRFETPYSFDWALLDQVTVVDNPATDADVVVDSTLTASINVTLTGDLDNDRIVNFKDFTLFAQNWLMQK